MSDELKREVGQHLMFVIFFVVGLFSTDIFMSGEAPVGSGGPENVANTSSREPKEEVVPARAVKRIMPAPASSVRPVVTPHWPHIKLRDDATDQALKDKIASVRYLEQRRIQTIEKVKPAVVAIFGLERQGGGSGVLIHPSGLALTNHHVIAAAGAEGYGGLADGKLYRWNLVGNDPGGDLALIQLIAQQPDQAFPFVAMGDSDQVKVGDWTLVMGNPFTLAEDYQPTVTFGIVSGVKRYQPGMQDTLLVYGNCIQVDTSINPGNSGGPLFDIDGNLIGINGRASFEFKKRGRVNVGLGYAISVNQCRNFLPELMATKLIQHGTLDAVFEDRDGKVICSAIYEDAEIGDLGLSLGDELLEFEKIQIHSANQFTNLICTLPAGWPAYLKIRKPGGNESEIRLRLVGLPYPKQDAPPARIKEGQPEPDNEEPKNGEKQKGTPKDSKPGDDTAETDLNTPKDKDAESKATDKTDAEVPLQQQIENSKKLLFQFMNNAAGEVQDPSLNQRNAAICMNRWQATLQENHNRMKAGDGFEVVEMWIDGDKQVASWKLTIKPDYLLAEMDWIDDQRKEKWDAWQLENAKWSVATTSESGDYQWQEINIDQLKSSAIGSQAVLLAGLSDWKALKTLGSAEINGVDKAADQIAVRLKLGTENSPFYIWLDLDDWTQTSQTFLRKSGEDINGRYGLGCVRYDRWEEKSIGIWPTQRTVISGLFEDEVISIATQVVQPINKTTSQ